MDENSSRLKGRQANHNPGLVSGPVKNMVARLLALQFILLSLWQYRSVKKSREVLKAMTKMKNEFLGDIRLSRFVFCGGKFYFNVHIPGFPSLKIIRNNLGELHRISPVKAHHNRLRVLLLSITNRCPLQCKHCYEWDNLNRPGTLSTEEYKALLSPFVASGLGQVHFGGGEPLLDYTCLLELTSYLKGKTDVWIATSGLGLNAERAGELKREGLTGAAISVDHFDENLHNEFRGSDRSFRWAMEATGHSLKAGLVTCWSLCTTREFLSEENMRRYAEFAASKGVHFIQVFEPLPAGRFRGEDVLLDEEQIAFLDTFYLSYNGSNSYRKMPLMTFPGFHQRKIGCMGGGNRYLYIDAWGNAHSCPFCRNDHRLNLKDMPLPELLEKLAEEECPMVEA